MVHELINFAAEKVTKHRDIAPRADTLKKLRSGKVRKEKKGRRHVGVARVLRENHVNKELRRLAEARAESARRQRAVEEKKRIAKERKATKETLDKQWRIDLQRYQEVDIPAWQAECAEVDIAWAAAKQLGQKRSQAGKRPLYPPRPKLPLKPKGGGIGASDPSVLVEGTAEDEAGGGVGGGVDGGVDGEVEEEDLVDSMRALDVAHFAEISPLL